MNNIQKNNSKSDSYNKILTIPNAITMGRIIASIGLFSFMLTSGVVVSVPLALLTAGIGATDAIDGYLARSKNMASRLGSILDPIADKVYNWGLCFTLMATGTMPLWPALILGRDLAVWSLYVYQDKVKNKKDLKPTIPAKAKMALQTMGVISTIAFGFGGNALGMIAPVCMGSAILSAIPEAFAIKKKYFSEEKKEQEYVPEKTKLEKIIEEEGEDPIKEEEKSLEYVPNIQIFENTKEKSMQKTLGKYKN